MLTVNRAIIKANDYIETMQINRLKLTSFRNIASTDISTNGGQIIAIYGANGAGKTSVLEAISLLSPGRGLNRSKLESHIQNGTKMWGLHADITSQNEARTVGMSYDKKRRQIKIDDLTADSQSELSTIGNVLWFTPRMDRLFMDGAQARREFLDRLVYGHNSKHAKNLSLYRHHIRSRIKLLKTNEGNNNSIADWLTIEEEQAAKYAVKIGLARRKYLQELRPYLEDVDLWQTGSFVRMLAEQSSLGHCENIEENPINLETAITAHFAETRARDYHLNSTLFGPHRSDMEGELLPLNNAPTATPLAQSSTGQHKRAILEILLANARLTHGKTGATPLILMDEITAHLDKKVRDKVFNSLTQLGTQIWLTGTEKSLFKGLQNVTFIKAVDGEFVVMPMRI